MKKKDITGYTGKGEPPCIVMTFTSNETAPPDLESTIILRRVDEPNNMFQFTRKAEKMTKFK